VRLIQLIHLIEEVLGIRAQIITKPMQKGDVDRTYADVSKAKKLLSWQPTTDIETGLEKMTQWIKNY
ncbi:MAG: GDP-mannose 4,6-dehydratase, partial [Candidatus Paceibacterota bacterium]